MARSITELGRIVEGGGIEASYGSGNQVAELRVQKTHINKDALIKSLHERTGAYNTMIVFAGVTFLVSLIEAGIALMAADARGLIVAGVSAAADYGATYYFAGKSSDSSERAASLSRSDQLPVVSVPSANKK